MLESINVRFFAYGYLWDDVTDLDIVEVEESTFNELASGGASITYERHSVFANGCRQVCLTAECTLDGEPI